MDEEQICNKCIYCVTYDYLRYSTSEGKKITIPNNHKCEAGLDLFLGITKCSHFEEKPEDTKSKPLTSARLSTSCVQPSNHGRKGAMPRSRKGCFKKKGSGDYSGGGVSTS